jgi:hypothetical protein
MTEEHAKLLLKDLSSRLPYGVKLQISSWDDEKMEYVDKADTLYSISSDNHVRTSSEDRDFYIDEVKPYLFPMSSMTDEQMEELEELCDLYSPDDDYDPYACLGIEVLYKHVLDDGYKFNFKRNVIDWFNKNHLDYRGLIDMGLAVDATSLGIY